MGNRDKRTDAVGTVLLLALLALLLGAFIFLTGLGCYTGNPDWPLGDPTQPRGPFPNRCNDVLPVYDGGTDLVIPPLPEKPPRVVTWCSR
jgi:hypothetical protein